MAQIDLIPESYRAYTRAKRIVCHAGFAAGGLVCVALSIFMYVHWQLDQENKQLVLLRQQTKEMAALQAQVNAMQEQKRQLETDVETLAMLRGEGDAARAIQALDRALNDDVWLSRLRFKRTHVSAAPDTDDTGPMQGAMLRVESGTVGADHQAVFKSRIEMHGAATGHAMLSGFMNAMAQQPEITKVRFLNSSAGNTESTTAMQFSVDAVIRTQGGKS